MDGKHKIVDVARKTILQEFHDHKKYVVRTRWAPNGSAFATSSYDKSICFYELVYVSLVSKYFFQNSFFFNDHCSYDSRSDIPLEGGFQLKKRLEFPGTVEAIEYTKVRND
jgi:WD40 repeat protein